MRLNRRAASLLFAMSILPFGPALAAEPDNTLILTLKDGDVTIALRPDLAPKHVARIKELVRAGEYNNVAFHRVIDGFMAQTGDVQYGDLEDGYNAGSVGMGGSKKPDLPAEFTTKASFQRGAVGMARSQSPDSANSQFFICFGDASFLDNQYTIVGQVESGMDLVDNIKRGEPVQDPDRIVKVRIASDK